MVDTLGKMALETRADAQDRAFAAEEQARLLIDSIRDYAIFLLTPDGRVGSWNTGAQMTMGYAPDEIIGKSIRCFHTPEDVALGKVDRLLEAATSLGRVEQLEWLVRKDGSRFRADASITRLQGKDGSVSGFAKIIRDLSERTQAEEALRLSEERFRLLVDSVQDYAIFMLDPEGHILTWNRGAERIKGYSAGEIIGRHFSTFYPQEDLDAKKPEMELRVATETGRFEEEAWRIRKDGTKFWANVVITAVRNSKGERVGFAKVTRDLTDRRRLELERIRLAQAEEAIRLRDEFLSIASHELKTPLTALQLQLHTLSERMPEVDEATTRRLERAVRSGERLGDLIETLFDVSRLSSGQLDLHRERVDLKAAVEDVVDSLLETAERDGSVISISAVPGLVGHWDRLRIQQVVTNILSNAIRYGAGTPIEITVRKEDGMAVCSIQDGGPGIPLEYKERVFERFERAFSMRNYGGMGLGLYVSRQIVEAHGGVIEADNAPGGGARVTFRLPLSSSTHSRAPAGAS